MKNLLCENPAIILNHRLKDLVLSHRNYTLRGKLTTLTDAQCLLWFDEFPYGRFGVKNLGISVDDVDDCYVIDYFTGDLIPIYIVVPCNKCCLCRDKIAREWATRAMCECQTSTGVPLFVTLTYNNWSLPEKGLDSKHVQLFMKRLRINLNRYLNYDVNLRFFLCGEYGSRTKRPHYHLLLWNFPALDSKKRTLSIIEKSWSYVISKRNLHHVPQEYVFKDDVANRHRALFGYVHLQEMKAGHTKYCMKYMRKDSKVPTGKNDVFFLCSRKRGLGFQWLQEHTDEYIKNPQLYDVRFPDRYNNGKVYSAAMPSYFKNLLYPCLSRIVPKEIRDNFGRFVWLLNVRTSLVGERVLLLDEIKLLSKFRQLPQYLPDDVISAIGEVYLHPHRTNYTTYDKVFVPYDEDVIFHRYGVETHIGRTSLLTVIPHYVAYEDNLDDLKDYTLTDISKAIAEVMPSLQSYSYNADEVDAMVCRKNIRLYWLQKEKDSKPQLSVLDAVRQVREKRQAQLNREFF